MKRYLSYILFIFILAACSPEINGNIGRQPEIFPDYREVTIPSNIAPMNFEVMSQEGTGWLAVVRGESDSLCIHSGDGLISFGKRQWKRLMRENAGGKISVKHARCQRIKLQCLTTSLLLWRTTN